MAYHAVILDVGLVENLCRQYLIAMPMMMMGKQLFPV